MMKCRSYIQHCDKNVGDTENLGIKTLSEVIDTFENFNWIKELKKIEDRQFYHLTSTQPNLTIQKENGEELVIERLNEDEYELNYLKGKAFTSFRITADFNENPDGISVQECIQHFYGDTLQDLYPLIRTMDDPTPLKLGKHSPLEALSIMLIMSVLLFIGGITLLSIGIKKIDLFFLIPPIILLSFGIVPIIFFIHYIRFPRINSFIYDTLNKTLHINYPSGEILIPKKDIIQCIYVYHSGRSQSMFSHLCSITLTLKNNEQHYLTCLSFTKSDLEQILEHLNINSYHFPSRFPMVNKKIYPADGSNTSKNPEMRTSELEESYNEAPDEFLIKIVENPEDYESEAVTIAKKILDKRKAN